MGSGGIWRFGVLVLTLSLLCFGVWAGCGGDDGGGGSSTATLKVVNSSSKSFNTVYVSLSSSSSWGTDQCSTTVGPGGTWTLTGISPGTYDIMIVATDSSYWTKYSWVFSAGGTNTLTLY